MSDYPIPDAVLVHHAAFLGKTRSGKTSSAKTAVERFVAAGERVCILDPIKSDWWGMISSADGAAPGLPFRILGGPHGHIPLPSTSGKVIGELVATGALPLSIVDMADFEMGGLQRFFIDFAETLFRKHRGILHLVIEEAHEFAPKEMGGFGGEGMAIHWAKKLATAGGSKGIRLIVATQRTQALHNAILGSCETMVAHRLTAPADQKPVVDWLKANVEKGKAAEIAGSLSSLPTGSAWVCSGEAQMFERVDFPRIATFDNSATPLTDDEAEKVQTAAVDVDALRALVGEAVAEAEANDPKKLKAEIARLKKEIEGKGGAPADHTECERRTTNLEQRALRAESLLSDMMVATRNFEEAFRDASEIWGMVDACRHAADEHLRANDWVAPDPGVSADLSTAPEKVSRAAESQQRGGDHELAPRESDPEGRATGRPSTPANGIPASQQRVLDAIAWWEAIGISPVERHRASVIAGLSPKASTFGVYISKLAQGGLVDTSTPGAVSLTDAGRSAANSPGRVDKRDVVTQARSMLKPAAAGVLDKILAHWPKWVRRDDLADECGLSRTASTLGVYISESSKLGFVETKPGMVRIAEWMMP